MGARMTVVFGDVSAGNSELRATPRQAWDIAEYDVSAPKSLGVTKQKDGQPLPKEYDQWPLPDGKIKTLSGAPSAN